MLRNQEKNSVVRGIFLIGDWDLGLGQDRFYEGDKKGGFLSTIGWSITFFSLSSLNVQVMNMLRVWKIIQIIPLTP